LTRSARMTKHYIGIDLGGTFIKAAVVTAEAEIVSRTQHETGADKGPDYVLDAIAEAGRDAVAKAALEMKDISAVGLGTPGLVLVDDGIVVTAPNVPWRDIPLRDEMAKRFGLPVVIENDANAAAMAEYWAGAGRGTHCMVILTLGTGIGGGIIIDGEIVHGAHGVAAELGHITIEAEGRLCGCGNHGCVEAYASANATARRFEEGIRAGAASSLAEKVNAGEEVTAREIHEAARAGDDYAKEVFRDTGRYLGIAMVNIMATIDPDKFVLAGGMAKAGEFFIDSVREEIDRRAYDYMAERTEVVFTELANDAGIIGAAGCALKIRETSP